MPQTAVVTLLQRWLLTLAVELARELAVGVTLHGQLLSSLHSAHCCSVSANALLLRLALSQWTSCFPERNTKLTAQVAAQRTLHSRLHSRLPQRKVLRIQRGDRKVRPVHVEQTATLLRDAYCIRFKLLYENTLLVRNRKRVASNQVWLGGPLDFLRTIAHYSADNYLFTSNQSSAPRRGGAFPVVFTFF